MDELNQLIEHFRQLNSIGKHKRVINTLSPTILKTYKDARLHYEAGFAHDIEGDSYSRGEQQYSRAIDLDPEYEQALYRRGKLYARKNEFDKSARDFERLISLNPREHTYHQARGEVYMSTGDYDKAGMCFTKAIELQTDLEDAWTQRGLAWLELNEPERTIDDETKVLSLNPNSMMAYNIRGRAFAKLSQYEKAIDDLTQAIRLEPVYLQNYEYRASVWDAMHNYPRAIEDFSKIIRFFAEGSDEYFRRGEIYFKMGEYEKAATDYNAASYFHEHGKANERMKMAMTELEKQNNAECFADKKLIRKKAAAFLDKIRELYGERFKKEKDGFRCGKEPEWDFENNRPKTADLAGWLPEIMPDIAKWDVTRSAHNDNILIETLTPIGELFYPHLVGIPIKEELWDAVNEPVGQHEIGERTLGYVRKFEAVGKLLERLIKDIRVGDLDDHLITEYYFPEITNDKTSRAYRKLWPLRPRVRR